MANGFDIDSITSIGKAPIVGFKANIEGLDLKTLEKMRSMIVAYKSSKRDPDTGDLVSIVGYNRKLDAITDAIFYLTGGVKQKANAKPTGVLKPVATKAKEQVKAPTQVLPKAKPMVASRKYNTTTRTANTFGGQLPIQKQQASSGLAYSYPKGQGDFFGKSSAFKLMSALSESNKKETPNVKQLGLDFSENIKKSRKQKTSSAAIEKDVDKLIETLEKAAIVQFENHIVKVAKKEKAKAKVEKVAKGPRVRTEYELAQEARRKQNSDTDRLNAETHARKQNIIKNIENRKLRHAESHDALMVERQSMSEKSKERMENKRNKRHKLDSETKLALMDRHVKMTELSIIKQEHKEKSDRLKAEDRRKIQSERKAQTNRNQMERHLHSIHPALGALYGMHQDNKEKQQKEHEDSGVLDIAAGTAVGEAGVGLAGKAMKKLKKGGMLASIGKNVFKGAAVLPYAAAITEGVVEGVESRDARKGLATTAGGILGAIVGGAIGTAIAPGAGTLIGGMAGEAIGSRLAKQAYTYMHDTTNAPDTSNSGKINAKKKAGSSGEGYYNQRVEKVQSPTQGTSKASKDFIAKQEGMSTSAYSDGVNKKTGEKLVSIGRGHQIKDNEYAQGFIQVGNDRIPISGERGINTKLTKEQGEALYTQDLQTYSSQARRQLGGDLYDKLNDNQKTALNSYAYNTGSINSLVKAGLKDKIASGDMSGAGALIKDKGIKTFKGQYNAGLDKRRGEESALFNEKAPSMVSGLTNQQPNNIDTSSTSTPNVIVGGSNTTGGSSVVNNTTINAPNTDATIRQLQWFTMSPGRIVS
jgi:GH24 family phage-related lysozyme (muramidase)